MNAEQACTVQNLALRAKGHVEAGGVASVPVKRRICRGAQRRSPAIDKLRRRNVDYEDQCPHLANPLSEGELRDNVLTCAAHEWTFDARTGDGVNPEDACLQRFPVRVDGDRILVQLGQA